VTVLLATSAEYAAGEPGAEHLDAALAARGVEASWAVWDDPAVDWAAADLVAVRSTWDYQGRLEEFLAWTRRVPRLLGGADAIAWNVDKAYLVGLGRTVPTVPTRLLDEVSASAYTPAVVKPRVGASGKGLVVVDRPSAEQVASGRFVVQPLVASITTRGESSVFVVDGRAVSQMDKFPAAGEVRVQEEYGGRTVPADLDPERAALAELAVASAGAAPFARVDLLHHGGRWVVGELELVEPGLYLEVDPVNAAPYADLLDRAVR
jgi:hypothetical protein